jgi:hypothetical protein
MTSETPDESAAALFAWCCQVQEYQWLVPENLLKPT